MWAISLVNVEVAKLLRYVITYMHVIEYEIIGNKSSSKLHSKVKVTTRGVLPNIAAMTLLQKKATQLNRKAAKTKYLYFIEFLEEETPGF